MSPAATVLRAALALSLLGSVPAAADPPEGCTGFPDIPQAWICVTQWSPENAVPAVTPGPGQTVVIPEFCAFDNCVGPTPVTIPTFVVTQGNGVIAVLTYDGQTHTVTVPPVPDPNALIQQVVTTVTGLVETVLGVAETVIGIVEDAGATQPPGLLTANVHVDCFGCGAPSSGSLNGSFTGMINGRQYQNAPVNGWLTSSSLPGALCTLSGNAVGSISIGSESGSFTWTQTGNTIAITFSGGITGSAHGLWQMPGAACGAAADATITAIAVTA